MTRIRSAVLRDGDVSVTLLNLGCITQDWCVPLSGVRIPVVLGYSNPQAYLNNPNCLGVIAGRVANRIEGAEFTLQGQRYALNRNSGAHHLHGGAAGLHTRLWEMEQEGDKTVQFRLTSDHMDQGYPGRVEFFVRVSLSGNALTYDMRALPDCATPINLAQHSYYNLQGQGDVWDHEVEIAATGFTPTRADLIPTGEVADLDAAAFDLRMPRQLKKADPGRAGLDLNYVLDQDAAMTARVTAPNGMVLTLKTDQPGLQLYTGARLAEVADPLPDQSHGAFSGVCLEPQGFPNSPNIAHFPSVIATPDRPYHQRTTVRIAPGRAG